jgi:hypothetical protein
MDIKEFWELGYSQGPFLIRLTIILSDKRVAFFMHQSTNAQKKLGVRFSCPN